MEPDDAPVTYLEYAVQELERLRLRAHCFGCRLERRLAVSLEVLSNMVDHNADERSIKAQLEITEQALADARVANHSCGQHV